MPRPRKNAVVEEPKKETLVAETPKKDDGLVALEHFAKKGRLFIGGESYEIVKGVVKVKPEHAKEAKEHIKLIGG